MIEEADAARWQIVGNPVFIPGHLHGSRYPSLAFKMTCIPLSEAQMKAFDGLLAGAFKAFHDLPQRDPSAVAMPALPGGLRSTARWFAKSLHRLQFLAGMPIFEAPRLL